MIAGVIKGKIVGRTDYRPDQSDVYCACIVVEVQTYADNAQQVQQIAVFVPMFMAKRVDFFLKPETKFITVAFDHMSAVPSTKQPGVWVIAVKASQLSS